MSMRAAVRIALGVLAVGLALVLLGAALPGGRPGGRPEGYTVDAGSRVRIDGTSTLGRYTCAAGEVAGAGDVPPAGPATAELTVGVASFDCGQSRMNRDFRRSLRAEAAPEIRFTLGLAETLAPEARTGAWVRVRAAGRLSLAGVERPVTVVAEGRRLGAGRVQLRGQHPLLMTDFGVRPPSGMLGLVRAHDRVVVVFDLTASSP